MSKKIKDNLEYLATNFFDSARSLKINLQVGTIIKKSPRTKKITRVKIKLDVTGLCVLFYILRSIDRNFRKTKKLQSRIYHTQISKYCRIHRTTASDRIQFFIKKRLIKVHNHVYSPGIYLEALSNVNSNTCRSHRHGKDMSLPLTSHRYVGQGDISDKSYISDSTVGALEPQKQKTISEQLEDKRKADIARQEIRNISKGLLKSLNLKEGIH